MSVIEEDGKISENQISGELLTQLLESTHESVPVTCPICNKILSSEFQLELHNKRAHENVKNHKCDVCEKSFKTNKDLKSHDKNVHSLETYKCDSCEKTFNTNFKIKKHVKEVHEGIKKFQCELCPRKIRDFVKLKMHVMTVHQGIKDFKCDSYGKLFSYGIHYNSCALSSCVLSNDFYF